MAGGVHGHGGGNADTTTVVDAASDTTTWPLLAGDQTGDQSPLTDSGLTYDAAANTFSSTSVSGTGLYGTSTSSYGVRGTSTSGFGVLGFSTSGHGVVGQSVSGRGVVAQGDETSPTTAAFRIVPQDADPTGPNAVGDIYITTAGVLKSCTVAGTPGTWQSVGAQT